jgi:hypothetical protein
MPASPLTRPDWDRLYQVAAAQSGYFSTRQAKRAGYSPQLLAKYLRNGRVVRALRGVYRIKHFPSSEWEDLVTAWLWSERAAVVSHETALSVLGLLTARPTRVHLTLPASWRRRRLRVPPAVVLHHADVPEHQRTRTGAVPTTSVPRTLLDCREARIPARIVRKALADARARGLIRRRDQGDIDRAFGPAAGTQPRRRVANARTKPTKFLCLICAEKLLERMSQAEAGRHLAQYRVLTDHLRKQGQLIGCNRLLPAETATTVRVRKGKVSTTDGPFAETKELVGGYFVIEARDRAEAIRVAARIPGARIGCVEVRPIADDPDTLRALGLVATSLAR